MTAPPLHRPQAPSRRPARGATAGSAWRLRPRGLLLVASLTLRRRAASRRWRWGLALWAVVLLALDLLFLLADALRRGTGSAAFEMAGLVLAVALLLVLPPLAAGQIQADRAAGRLEVLRASLLSPAEIIGGHALASWTTSVALIGLALPSLLPGAVLAGHPLSRVLAVAAVLAMVSLAIALLGAGLSVRAARRSGAVVRTAGAVAILVLGLPILWSASLPLLTEEQEVLTSRPIDADQILALAEVPGVEHPSLAREADVGVPMILVPVGWLEASDAAGSEDPWRSVTRAERWCVFSEESRPVPRSDLLLPLLAVHPLVAVAEVSPPGMGVLSTMRSGLDGAAHPAQPARFTTCSPGDVGHPEVSRDSTPAWPVGLAVWLLAGGGAAALAVRRLSVPTRGDTAERGVLR
ncbi:hypothetical protein [Brachybacterium phenoliresistens]|uniref:hypothetical protein n=1 Tax=Brachybacterium phenoliresistens TaxID=396014 RepID=UPI0031D558CC